MSGSCQTTGDSRNRVEGVKGFVGQLNLETPWRPCHTEKVTYASRPQVQEQPRQRCRDDQVVRPSGRARGLEKKDQGRIHHGRFRRVYFRKSGRVKSGLPRVCLPDKSTPPSTSLTVHFCLVRVTDVHFTGELFCEGTRKCETVSYDWWYWDNHPTRLEEVAGKQMQSIVLFVRDTERRSPQGRFLVFVQSLYSKFLYSVLAPIFFHLCCFCQMNSESHMKHTDRHPHTWKRYEDHTEL